VEQQPEEPARAEGTAGGQPATAAQAACIIGRQPDTRADGRDGAQGRGLASPEPQNIKYDDVKVTRYEDLGRLSDGAVAMLSGSCPPRAEPKPKARSKAKTKKRRLTTRQILDRAKAAEKKRRRNRPKDRVHKRWGRR
jgi:hypothetical protein